MDGFTPSQEQMDLVMPFYMMHRQRIAKCKKVANLRVYKDPFLGSLNPDEMNLMRKVFDDADANRDGFLDETEFLNFRERQTLAWSKIYGGNGCQDLCKPLPKEMECKSFEIINKLNPDTPGIKKEDLGKTNMICQRFNMRPGAMYRVWFLEFYGRAEAIRLLLTHAGIEWQDMQLSRPQMLSIKDYCLG